MVRLGLDGRALLSFPCALLLPLQKWLHAVKVTRGRRDREEGSAMLGQEENELIGNEMKMSNCCRQECLASKERLT